ncbi:MAG: M20 family metallo-hydrolase [Opitutales bacterium]
MNASSVHTALHWRLAELRGISDGPGLTRAFLTPALRRAHETIAAWLDPERFSLRTDPLGNLFIRLRQDARIVDRPRLLLGSHLDTVRDAGAFDGSLGFLLALATLESVGEDISDLGGPIPEVVGFSDEEGLRFQTAYLGSSYVAGSFDRSWLDLTDGDGLKLSDALTVWGGDPEKLVVAPPDPPIAAYLEAHIEQGPVLEMRDEPCGVVTAIAAQTRAALSFSGQAGHAGTVPMEARRDALTAAAEWIGLVESAHARFPDLRTTVGQLIVSPNASNVIPGKVTLTLDARHPVGPELARAVTWLEEKARAVAGKRRLDLEWNLRQSQLAVACDTRLREAFLSVLEAQQETVPLMPSGAGHDAVALSHICPVGMLFVRCREGLSHCPEEHVEPRDIEAAFEAYSEAALVAARALAENPVL